MMRGSKEKFINNKLDENLMARRKCDIAGLRLFKTGYAFDIDVFYSRL